MRRPLFGRRAKADDELLDSAGRQIFSLHRLLGRGRFPQLITVSFTPPQQTTTHHRS
jgi:hypothetical protein